ncbi:MAG: ligase-associated DNA damage response endonuclease PdeM [Pseudomonadota bacterium]
MISAAAQIIPPPDRLVVNGVELIVDISGAVVWPERSLMMVADLHLEKGSAFAVHGRLLPPYDTRTTLNNLLQTIEKYEIKSVVCIGDSFHDERAADRLCPADQDALQALTGRCDWTWICGNHDPAPPENWGGHVAEELTLGPLTLRHEAASNCASGEISGHYHPKAAVRVRQRRLSGRCAISDGRRMILPAFGAYTGGLSVLDSAISDLFPAGFEVRLLGRNSVFAFPKSALTL